MLAKSGPPPLPVCFEENRLFWSKGTERLYELDPNASFVQIEHEKTKGHSTKLNSIRQQVNFIAAKGVFPHLSYPEAAYSLFRIQ